jgi:hypothetical protein
MVSPRPCSSRYLIVQTKEASGVLEKVTALQSIVHQRLRVSNFTCAEGFLDLKKARKPTLGYLAAAVVERADGSLLRAQEAQQGHSDDQHAPPNPHRDHFRG